MFEIIFPMTVLQTHPANTPWDFELIKRACGWQELFCHASIDSL
jgi:hypothetical protein